MKLIKPLLFTVAYGLILLNGLLAVILVATAYVLSPVQASSTLLLTAGVGFLLTMLIALRLQKQSKQHFAQLVAIFSVPHKAEQAEPVLANN